MYRFHPQTSMLVDIIKQNQMEIYTKWSLSLEITL